MTIIFSYNRPKMLSKLLDEVGHCVVLDDGSEYDPAPFIDRCDYYRLHHLGKEFFWLTWRYALQMCKESDDDLFIFLQDDLSNVDLDRIHTIHASMEGDYAYNVHNAGGHRGWTPIKHREEDDRIFGSYVDCNYFCNRQALEVLGFDMDWINPMRFKVDGISSGVGQQQSRKFYKANVPMYIPKKSLAYHGDHKSLMHPEERKRNPLISR